MFSEARKTTVKLKLSLTLKRLLIMQRSYFSRLRVRKTPIPLFPSSLAPLGGSVPYDLWPLRVDVPPHVLRQLPPLLSGCRSVFVCSAGPPVNYTYEGVIRRQLKAKRPSPAGFQRVKSRICINSRVRWRARDGPQTLRDLGQLLLDCYIQELGICRLFCRSAQAEANIC